MTRPNLISKDKHLAYLNRRNVSPSGNICEGCPYDFACCKNGETFLFTKEAEEISARTGLGKTEFAKPLTEPEYLALATKGIRVSFRLKTPCHFFSDGNCTIHDFKPRACRAGICDYAFSNWENEMTNKHHICKQDNTIVSGWEAQECGDYSPDEAKGQPNCSDCQHSKPSNLPLHELLKTRNFKPLKTCPYPCLFRGVTDRCSMGWHHTDRDCECGRRRQTELCPVSSKEAE